MSLCRYIDLQLYSCTFFPLVSYNDHWKSVAQDIAAFLFRRLVLLILLPRLGIYRFTIRR